MDSEKIGRFIKLLREEKNWNQIDLANKLYVTQQAVSSWENGKAIPDIEKIKSLSLLFDVEIVELYAGERIQSNLEKNEVIYNVVKDEKGKLKKIFCISAVIIFLLIFLFLFYFFVNSYKSINVYLIGTEESNLNANGLMITSKEKVYFQLQVDGLDIKEMSLMYRDKLIFRTEDAKIGFQDRYGYNEYISYDVLDDWINNLYLKIIDSDDQYFEIKLVLYKDFENSSLFFPSSTLINVDDNITIENSFDVPSKIMNTFVYENGNYNYEFTKDNKKVWMSYMGVAGLFLVEEVQNNLVATWRYFVQDDVIYYEQLDANGTIIYNFNSDTDDINIEKNKELLKYFYANYVEKYF